jgi:branched-subunit amino acid transport protein AzlD
LQVTDDVPFVILSYDRMPKFVFAMSATMGALLTVAACVGWLGLLMRTTAKSVFSRRKTYAMQATSAHAFRTALHLQRDGCPYVINIGQARSDWYYDKKKYGFQAR